MKRLVLLVVVALSLIHIQMCIRDSFHNAGNQFVPYNVLLVEFDETDSFHAFQNFQLCIRDRLRWNSTTASIPLRNISREKFSLGEWMASLSNPNPLRTVFIPKICSKSLMIGILDVYKRQLLHSTGCRLGDRWRDRNR